MKLRLILCATWPICSVLHAAPRPNVILIMTDDQKGYGDLGYSSREKCLSSCMRCRIPLQVT